MKVLSIGNSFSEDAHSWLHKLAELNDVKLDTLNLCSSGCCLERHWNQIQKNAAVYSFQPNGTEKLWKINVTVEGALKLADWDVITVQQASRFTGMPETHEPYLSNIVNLVRNTCPKADIWFHQTWAYDVDSKLESFENYDYSQQNMYQRIVSTAETVAKSIDAKIIPSGTLIQTLRTTVPEFDYPNGGISLCRDGAHLSLDYGRFAIAALWLRKLTGITVKAENFEDFDPKLLKKILDVVNAF